MRWVLCLGLLVVFFQFSVSQSCTSLMNGCTANISSYEPFHIYDSYEIPVHHPDTWKQLCSEYEQYEVVECMQDALPYCVVNEYSYLDFIAAMQYRCSEEALQVYNTHWECLIKREYEDAFKVCADALAENLFWAYCNSFEEFFECMYTSTKIQCGEELAIFVTESETLGARNSLMANGCDDPAQSFNLSICDQIQARQCITSASGSLDEVKNDHSLMCRSVSTIEYTFHSCYGRTATGCEGEDKESLDQLLPAVTMVIDEINEICNATEIAECSQNDLESCVSILYRALDMSVDEICSQRIEMMQNFGLCLSTHLPGCPQSTQETYRETEDFFMQSWFSEESNKTCAQDRDCTDLILQRLDSLVQCADEVQNLGTTLDDVCRTYDHILSCMSDILGECESAVEILKDYKLDTSFRQALFMGCNVTYFGKTYLAQEEVGCVYPDVLQCYDPLLYSIGIQDPRDLSLLDNVTLAMLTSVEQDKQLFCSHLKEDLPLMKNCLESRLPQCHNMTQTLASVDPYQIQNIHQLADSQKLLTFIMLEDAEALCSNDCEDLRSLLNDVQKCKTAGFYSSYVKAAIWYPDDYDKENLETSCSILRNFTKCVLESGGQCPYLQRYFLNIEKYVYPDMNRTQLLDVCRIDINGECKQSFKACTDPVVTALGDIYDESSNDVTQQNLRSQLQNEYAATCSMLNSLDVQGSSTCTRQVENIPKCQMVELFVDKYDEIFQLITDIRENTCNDNCTDFSRRMSSIKNRCTHIENSYLGNLVDEIQQTFLSGNPIQKECSELEDMFSCISYQAGQCAFLQEYVRETFLGKVSYIEALDVCQIGYKDSQQAYTTTTPVTTTSRGVCLYPQWMLMIVTLLILLIWCGSAE